MADLAGSRRLDHLYNSGECYVVSDGRDHMRTHFRSTAGGVERVPETGAMFSALQHMPRHTYRMKSFDNAPYFIPRDAQAARSTLNENVNTNPKSHNGVSGHNRVKYFRRPVMGQMPQVPPEILLAPPPAAAPAAPAAPAPEATRTLGTQSDYRESETQTDPYTPDYFIQNPADEPEILTLATLAHGQGLPAGLAEVEMIERARAKRKFENSLPPITDEASFNLRRKMMEEQELREWADREEEIRKLQNERLEVLRSAMQQRDEENESINDMKVERLRETLTAKQDAKKEEIAAKRARQVRKLTNQRQNLKYKKEARDIIGEYGKHGSVVNAPITHQGAFADTREFGADIDNYSAQLATFQGVVELDKGPSAVRMVPVKGTLVEPARSKPVPKTSESKRLEKLAHDLERAQAKLDAAALGESLAQDEEEIPEIYRPVKPLQRPPTPTIEPPIGADNMVEDEEAEAFKSSVLLLQQLIRGRAVQNMMFDGKEKRFDLIQELRMAEQMSAMEEELNADDRAEEEQQHMADMQQSYVQQLQGAVVSDSLDYLSKELVRKIEERRIHAMVLLAERERRAREAEEAGRRQQEAALQAREDEMFKQVMDVHADTVQTYLQQIVAGAVDKVTDKAVDESMRRKALQINNVVDQLEEKFSDPATVVQDLVHSFLLPHVAKEKLRRDVEASTQRFRHAAKAEIYHASGAES